MRLDEFARQQFFARLDKLEERIEKAHSDPDPDAVHDLRVAIRRLRQVLVVFREMLPAEPVRRVLKRLKELQRSAGEARDLDIASDLIGVRAPAAVRTKLIGRRSKAISRLRVELDRVAANGWTAKWRERMMFRVSAEPPLFFAKALIQPIEDALLSQGDQAVSPRTSGAELHKFRIAAKRLRFTLEVFEPLDESAFGPRIAAVRKLQDILGVANDCMVAAGIVTELQGPATIADRLLRRQRRLTAQFRREWPEISGAIKGRAANEDVQDSPPDTGQEQQAI